MVVVVAMEVLSAGHDSPVLAHEGNTGACNPNLPWDRPEGLLFYSESSQTQYLIRDCGKWPFANAYDLISQRFSSSAVMVSDVEAAGLVAGNAHVLVR